MTEHTVEEPEQVEDLHELRDWLVATLRAGARGAQPIDRELLERLADGPLNRYRLASDAVVHVLCNEPNYLRILHDRGRYWVRLMVYEDCVYTFDEHPTHGRITEWIIARNSLELA